MSGRGLFLGFAPIFWVVIFMELFERGAYYGLMSVLADYLRDPHSGLGFSEGPAGMLLGTVTPVLYFVPILGGALAERLGYRRMLAVAFALLSAGYYLSSCVTSYGSVLAALLVMAVGAGLFKPIPSGSIARLTTQENSTLGFGIFYWTINLGAFLFPLFLVSYLKQFGWQPVFWLSAGATGLMLLPALLLYRDPPRPENRKSMVEVLQGALLVLRDFRFVALIVIYAGFWVLYFQMFHTVLWYLRDYVDMYAVDHVVNRGLELVGLPPVFRFEVQHVTVVNAGTIIALQFLVSRLVKRTRALPTMVCGVGIATCGMGLLAVSSHPAVFLAGITVFSVGEMVTHPKFLSYVGTIAPQDKVALYMGYAFLYGVIGSSVGGVVGGNAYQYLVKGQNNPQLLWILLSGIGLATIVGLLLFDRVAARKVS